MITFASVSCNTEERIGMETNKLDDLIIRKIKDEDIEKIVAISTVSFGDPEIPFKRKHFESQLEVFPEGQLCVEYQGEVVGSCNSVIVNFDEYGDEHSFDEIADKGFIRNHNPNGRNLYGTEVVVDPNRRSLGIGRKLYEGRQAICRKFNLESILFGGRIPNFHKYADRLSVEEYCQQVIQGEIYDPVFTFQLRNGFKLRAIMENYLPKDLESLKYATLMEWHNPDYRSNE